ncbi:MAG: FIG00660544: hypothetical protein [uncultured Acidimicrobiales bacterium]|uniref:Iron-containing redox enzyme family protein n=1 Tax=uncultured Acidimicrobiales bacterium TaxID=310071 RepID=A0A6J4J353_9ACTN|nr:MAG: FIG00660544: hypothetical protein [uncultured Acidimicrobiales bacterium]
MTRQGGEAGADISLPTARGPVSDQLIQGLRRPPHHLRVDGLESLDAEDPLVGDDLHLALYTCYELHYRSFCDVDDAWEWHPSVLALRSSLEQRFLDALVDDIGPSRAIAPDAVGAALHETLASGTGPSLSSFMASRGSLRQLREFAIHRSAYQLKEADPHTWAIPRLYGSPKAALVKIQADEYGNGEPDEVHATRFAMTMVALGLDATYGAYLDRIPGVTLATVNLVSLFGLHRRWRGALVGHLAIFEMASVVPMGRYAQALRRLGYGTDATGFYDVHVLADAVHEKIAEHDLAVGFANTEPRRAGDILFGARAIMAVEERFARHLVDAWNRGETSLSESVPRLQLGSAALAGA